MPDPKSFPVFDSKGRVGNLYANARFLDERAERVVRLDSGEELRVSAAALEVRPDGSFLLKTPVAELLAQAQPAKPSPAEPAKASPAEPAKPAKAESSKSEPTKATSIPTPGQPVGTRTVGSKLPEDALFRDAYDIERVAVERLLDGPVTQRHEGDTLILPVVEEVLVFEKRLMLREEIRITPRKERVAEARTIELGKI